MTEAISLTIPAARPYHGVVRLVVGGLAARLDVPFAELEDLQLALETLLADGAGAAGREVTLELGLRDGGLGVAVGPFDAARLRAELARDVPEAEGIGLARLLSTVMGGYDVSERDGGGWITMHKPLHVAGEATA